MLLSWLPNQASATGPSSPKSPDPTPNGSALGDLFASLQKVEDEHRQQLADKQQQLSLQLEPQIMAISAMLKEDSAAQDSDFVTDKREMRERILGEGWAAHSARIRARNERFNALMSGSNPINIGQDELEAVYQSREEIDKIQEEITSRTSPPGKHPYLLANEHIFGGPGPDDSIYIATCDVIKRESKCARSLREKARTAFTYQQCSRIIEINLAEDKKLQRVISVFGGMLANIDQKEYKDPYWMLAQYVQNLFEYNDVEKEHLAKLSSNDKDHMIIVDDKTLSKQLAVLLGEMVGSSHDCAPNAYMFKVIADFFQMPCRVISTGDHVFNLGLDQDGKWQRMDVAQMNFQGMTISNFVDSPSMPVPATSLYDYSKASGTEGVFDGMHDAERAVVTESHRRTIPISVPDFLEQIKHAQVLEQLEEFLMENDKYLHTQFVKVVRPILKEFHVVEASLDVVGDKGKRKELLARHVKALIQVRQVLDELVVLCLDNPNVLYRLYEPLVAWLESDADRKLYLQSIEKLVTNRGRKYQAVRKRVSQAVRKRVICVGSGICVVLASIPSAVRVIRRI